MHRDSLTQKHRDMSWVCRWLRALQTGRENEERRDVLESLFSATSADDSLCLRILLCSHLDAFGTFALGPKPCSNVAAHVLEQLLHFIQSRSRLLGGGNISYLAALYSQHITSVKPVGIREDKDAEELLMVLLYPVRQPRSVGKSAET